jgi:DHA1 family purine ribonucleoside efflux pump-like MFS transporter
MTTDTSKAARDQAAISDRKASWGGVVSLGIGVFALVMAEFLPASLLSPIAAGLGVSEGVAGQSVAITAVVAAIAGLTIPVLLPRLDRRHLVISLSVLAVISDLLVAAAPVFTVLLVARVLLGVAIGGFWALAISIVSQLVPPAKLGRGVSVVQVGVSLATVAAVPLGTFLGELWGWRAVFVLAAGVGVIAILIQVFTLPSVRSTGAPGFRPLFATLRSRLLLLGLVAMALVGAGHFAGFTYIRPAASGIGDAQPDQIALLLVVYGVAIFIGNLLAGPLADKRMRLAVLLFPAVLGAAMITFALAGGTTIGLLAAIVFWGLGFGGVPTAVSTWLGRAEPDRLESVGGLQAAIFQLAIALGALIGGLLVDGVGVQAVFIIGGISAIVGAVVIASVRLGAPARVSA